VRSRVACFAFILLIFSGPVYAKHKSDYKHTSHIDSTAAATDSLQPSGLSNDDCSKFPNPFCCDCKICFFISSPQWIQIKVYSLRGEEVYSDTSNYESGGHTVYWCPPDRTQGIYFYKLIAHDRIVTGKLKQGN
jgi:hypothetical protein